MTQQQRSELDRAIERAAKNGIEILAHGTYKATGEIFYITSSHSAADASHVVIVRGHSLLCDCPARCICSHRGAVHARLAADAATEARAALEAENARVWRAACGR